MGAPLDPRSVPAALRDACDPLAACAEDAGLNATHVSEQALVAGWLVRFANSRAKRARSVNAIGVGTALSFAERLQRVDALYAAAALPTTFRITPFSQPAGLDDMLAEQGFLAFEESRVMTRSLDALPARIDGSAPIHAVDAREFAETAGHLYGDAPARIAVDVARALAFPARGLRLLLGERDAPLAVGCILFDGRMAGVYGLHTRADVRGRGYGARLLLELLHGAANAGAAHACLQVGAANDPARALYRRTGFGDRYAYWYRAREIE
ncbi:GNAT family N-acetyltransferase [Niveibacterium umoris]|uniref:Ribosomal protein S18 acetylase RimI-like enzyme n=1 Tax=Niveibacterium umoris TaxID=1193620 RepID=A0A840BJ97_9RHOO|nr:GNAT family N-acetyltransferase [Niveibacterium umoris]MBB4013621.1 ribosomal protein S18 acetylase RimI-like enzyme [Niveibacterium umoris]